MWKIILPLVLAVFCSSGAFGHAAPTRIVDAPLRVRGNALLDRNGFNVELSGVNVPEAVAVQPTNRVLFKVIRRRWNFNSVRLPVSVSKWARGGDAYVAEIGGAIRQANEAKLAVVLVAREDAALPSPVMLRFWTVWAERFKTNDSIVFDVFDKPSPAGIPGYSTARRDAKQWEYWFNGGTTTDGRTTIGMKHLVEAIRATGAKQVVAVQAFSDSFGFQGLDPAHWIPDQNVIYEIHPHLNRAMTSAQRDSTFGFLSDRLHLYAGEWGFPLQEDTDSCRSIPRDVTSAIGLFWEMVGYFIERKMSWTASSFEVGSLVSNYENYANTKLERVWICGDKSDPSQGMGELMLLAMTGDPTGFGEIAPEFIANSATGLTGAIAPGAMISIYGVEIGPDPGLLAQFDDEGRIGTSIGGVQVMFDGVPAPVFLVSAYQVNVQVPYSVAGKTATEVQLVYDELPSSPIRLAVAEASPGFITDFSRAAKALNQNGSLNSALAPAIPGSVIVLFVAGAGEISPHRTAGQRAIVPLGVPALPISVRIGSDLAEVLYAGEAPGLIGVIQLNVRVPEGPMSPRAVTRPIHLLVGTYSSTSTATIWVR